MTVRCLGVDGHRCTVLVRNGSRCPQCARKTRAKRGNEKALRNATIARDGRRCAECGVITTEQHGPTKTEVDHTIAVANGGRSTLANTRVLCRVHNRRKGAR